MTRRGCRGCCGRSLQLLLPPLQRRFRQEHAVLDLCVILSVPAQAAFERTHATAAAAAAGVESRHVTEGATANLINSPGPLLPLPMKNCLPRCEKASHATTASAVFCAANIFTSNATVS